MYSFLRKALAGAASAALLLPSSAFAADVWSAVTVDQYQDGSAHHFPLDLQQSANVVTNTTMGSHTSAHSSASANQANWFRGSGSQRQTIGAASGLEWGHNGFVEASTSGSVNQHQSTAAGQPARLSESAQIWQQSTVGNNVSHAGATLHQVNIGDAHQRQALAGATHSEGFVNSCHWCSSAIHGGNTVAQRITIEINNLFNF